MVKYENQCKCKVKELRRTGHISKKYQSFPLPALSPKLTSTNEFKLNGFHHELLDWFNQMSNLLCASVSIYMGFPGGSVVQKLPANSGDTGSVPGSGRPPEEGHGNPLQHSWVGNPWTEEPGSLQFVGLQRVRCDLGTKEQEQQKHIHIWHNICMYT